MLVYSYRRSLIILTGTRMIHPSVPCVPLIQITHTNIPIAPTSARIRRNNCIHRVRLIFTLVRGLMGFQLRLPYGLWKLATASSRKRIYLHNEIRIWMFVEFLGINQRPFLLWPRPGRGPACLCRSSGIEASFSRAGEGKFGWVVVKKRRINTHVSRQLLENKKECVNPDQSLIGVNQTNMLICGLSSAFVSVGGLEGMVLFWA